MHLPRLHRHRGGSPLAIGLLASLLMVLLPVPAQAAGSFADDDGSVFEANIEALAAAGITRGCNPPDNTRFCPDDLVTRAQMAAFLDRALDLTDGAASFQDVDGDSVFAGNIGALAAAGITRGCNPPDNTRFCPDDFVTRAQMAAFLNRALDLPAGLDTSFTDVSSSDTFALDIGALSVSGITRGCNPPANDRFCPDDLVTRAQMAAFLDRAGLTNPALRDPSLTPLNQVDPSLTLEVLDAGEISTANIDPDGTSVIVVGDLGLEPGDYVAAGVTSDTPTGLLGRVVAVSPTSGGQQLTVVPATLPELIPNGSFSTSIPLSRATANFGPSGSPVTTSAACKNGGTAEVTYEFGPSGEMTMDASWGLFSGLTVDFDADLSISAVAGAELSGNISCSFSLDADAPNLPPVTFAVGPVPVTVVPQVQVTLTGSGKAEAGIKLSVSAIVGVAATVDYADGSFDHSITPTASLPVERDVSAEANLRVDAYPTITALFYGAAGPSISAGPYLEGRFAPLDDPCIDIDAGVTGGLGFSIDFLGLDKDWNVPRKDLLDLNVFDGDCRPEITTSTLPTAEVGTPYSHSLTREGGLGPFTWSLASGQLPAGIKLSSGGVLSGTPTTPGISDVVVRVRDGLGLTDTAELRLVVTSTDAGDGPSADVSGPGATIIDADVTGDPSQFGKVTGFVPGASTWVLSTGLASDVIGDPGTEASTDLLLAGDGALSTLAGYPTYDAVTYTADVVPDADTLVVRYAFASEEYPEYVDAGFNDVVAVFVDGVNCAFVPGTNVPVSVDSINATSNSQYFVDNATGASGYATTMDGLTVPLECRVAVTPGEVVTVKIALADAGDGIVDSAVALLDGGIFSE